MYSFVQLFSAFEMLYKFANKINYTLVEIAHVSPVYHTFASNILSGI